MSASLSSPGSVPRRASQESAIHRYHRIANLEAVLSIREKQQRRARRLVLWTGVVIMSVLGIAAAAGWL